jgi:hypothetical protein
MSGVPIPVPLADIPAYPQRFANPVASPKCLNDSFIDDNRNRLLRKKKASRFLAEGFL